MSCKGSADLFSQLPKRGHFLAIILANHIGFKASGSRVIFFKLPRSLGDSECFLSVGISDRAVIGLDNEPETFGKPLDDDILLPAVIHKVLTGSVMRVGNGERVLEIGIIPHERADYVFHLSIPRLKWSA